MPVATRAFAWMVAAGLWSPSSCNPWAPGPEDDALQGIVELDETTLAFEVGGRVRTIAVEEGQSIEPQQVVATLDDELERVVRESRVLEAAVARAQAAVVEAGSRKEDLSAMESRIRAAKAAEDSIANNLQRQQALLSQGATTRAAVDDLKWQLERAVAERRALEDGLKAMRKGARKEEISAAESQATAASAGILQTDARLHRYELRAAARGVVLDVHVDPGEVVVPGGPVVTLADPDHPTADVFVPEGEVSGIRVGTAASVRVDGVASDFVGKVEWISRRTEFTPRFLFSERERSNLVIRIRIRIEDPEHRLFAGVPARVRLERDAAAG